MLSDGEQTPIIAQTKSQVLSGGEADAACECDADQIVSLKPQHSRFRHFRFTIFDVTRPLALVFKAMLASCTLPELKSSMIPGILLTTSLPRRPRRTKWPISRTREHNWDWSVHLFFSCGN